MNVNKTPVNNAANLSMFMVNVSAKLLAPLRLESELKFSGLEYQNFERYRSIEVFTRNFKNIPSYTSLNACAPIQLNTS